ncbi:hypothetical protein PC129_g1082 [Phytophthora cactorum]|uniref:Uncharacterized protein n=1 Tax=Phytophthora cactorum TaxID=29920 RepID=A0A8T1DDU5_9STRA|nr:hypothetical protein PC112_g4348 [Phytophthora cactorum]KAG2840781.1 hypothetical protein PC111_g3336 [Phytophthora cactorum]KAG2864819.1 hypothetical protein PC113_g4242 [Phytophthora cactorum]KAG2923816.1 hypothetical protein PC114_g4659 [Phytophthora cactorum]KAG2938200.1 hypothetical protein PC115_g3836 [Phytophthora cactorum]
MEGAVTVTTKWSRIYFVSFYVVGVVMVLSLVVAFVVEAYFEDTNEALRVKNKNTKEPVLFSTYATPTQQHLR